MHLKATAVLFGVKLRDLGGKLTRGKPYWRHFGAILGPSLTILWVMLKRSRAMVGHVEANVRYCSAMLLDLCPKVLSPETPRFSGGFGELCFIHLGVKCRAQILLLGAVGGS